MCHVFASKSLGSNVILNSLDYGDSVDIDLTLTSC